MFSEKFRIAISKLILIMQHFFYNIRKRNTTSSCSRVTNDSQRELHAYNVVYSIVGLRANAMTETYWRKSRGATEVKVRKQTGEGLHKHTVSVSRSVETLTDCSLFFREGDIRKIFTQFSFVNSVEYSIYIFKCSSLFKYSILLIHICHNM